MHDIKEYLKQTRTVLVTRDAFYDLVKKASTQPERKKGKWIYVNGHTAIDCSACYHCSWSLSFEDTVKRFKFCPNCGAEMEGLQVDK